MSYDRNARVGALRSNAADVTAILFMKNNLNDNGLAIRISILQVRLRPYTSQPMTVQCHNGSVSEAEMVTFWPKVVGQLATQLWLL